MDPPTSPIQTRPPDPPSAASLTSDNDNLHADENDHHPHHEHNDDVSASTSASASTSQDYDADYDNNEVNDNGKTSAQKSAKFVQKKFHRRRRAPKVEHSDIDSGDVTKSAQAGGGALEPCDAGSSNNSLASSTNAGNEFHSFGSGSTASTKPIVHLSGGLSSKQRNHISSGGSHSSGSRNKNRVSTPMKGASRLLLPSGIKRVPGGAAAKLFGPLKAKNSEENDEVVENTNSADDPPTVDITDILDVMNKTKTMFEKGNDNNRRYVNNDEDEEDVNTDDDTGEDGDDIEGKGEEAAHNNNQNTRTIPRRRKNDNGRPSILNRSEAIPENAAASVAALLAPRAVGDNCSVQSGHVSLSSFRVPPTPGRASSVISGCGGSLAGSSVVGESGVNAFQTPNLFNSTDTGGGGNDSISLISEHFQENANVPPGRKLPTTKPILSDETQKKIDLMSQKMTDPSRTLSDLLKAIATPTNREEMDRGYMVRRKNACGALQVLTAHAKKRKAICWTLGVLPALTSVLQDGGEESLTVAFPDPRTRKEYEEARKRAISTLMNLSMPVQNRLAVFHTPGLIQAIIDVLFTDEHESLQGCCAVLAYLAKSIENRILMARVPGLFEAVLHVLKPEEVEVNDSVAAKKMVYPWSSTDDSDISTSSADGSAFTGTSGEVTTDDDESMAGTLSSSESTRMTSDSEPSMLSTSDDESSIGGSSTSGGKRTVTVNTSSGSRFVTESKSEEGVLRKRAFLYDQNKIKSGARQNLFAMLMHLVKEKDNAFHLARVNDLVATVSQISRFQDSVAHPPAVQFLSHLTRHRLNTKMIVFQFQMVIPALVDCTYSFNEVARKYACFALQNLANDKSCRHELANSERLVTALCHRARVASDSEERFSAVCALKNLAYDPANLIPMSNTPECIATLMHIAHGKEEGISEKMQFQACDALATLSHWLRKIATNGQTMDHMKRGTLSPTGLFVPSLKVITWSQWQ